MATIENMAGLSESERRALIRGLDGPELLAQELVQKGAMHVVDFLLMEPGNTWKNLQLVKQSLDFNGMLISEECARRGQPVVQLKK